MRKCVFAGTFDPPTVGHKKVIDECLQLFDEVVVALLINRQKTPRLTLEERITLLQKLYKDQKRVKVVSFEGAVVDLLEKENTPYYVRGIRNTIDFEYENQNYFANKKLKDDIITIYLPAPQDMIQVSSTLVRNSADFAKEYSFYLPQEIAEETMAMLEKSVCSNGK